VERSRLALSMARATCSRDIVEVMVPFLLQPTCAAKRERLTWK